MIMFYSMYKHGVLKNWFKNLEFSLWIYLVHFPSLSQTHSFTPKLPPNPHPHSFPTPPTPLTLSFPHWIAHSYSHSHTYLHTLTPHSLTPSLTPPLPPSLTHSLTPNHSQIRSVTLTNSLPHAAVCVTHPVIGAIDGWAASRDHISRELCTIRTRALWLCLRVHHCIEWQWITIVLNTHFRQIRLGWYHQHRDEQPQTCKLNNENVFDIRAVMS